MCVCARRHLIPTTKLHVFIVVVVESAAAAQRSSGSRRGFCASYAIQRVNKTGSPTFCGKRVRINPAPRLRTPFPHKHHHPPSPAPFLILHTRPASLFFILQFLQRFRFVCVFAGIFERCPTPTATSTARSVTIKKVKYQNSKESNNNNKLCCY